MAFYLCASQDWLLLNLVHVLELFPTVHAVGLYPTEAGGPPIEAELERQREIVETSHVKYPVLAHVRFKRDASWAVDFNGQWVATYHGMWGKRMVVSSPLKYSPAKEVSSSCGEHCSSSTQASRADLDF